MIPQSIASAFERWNRPVLDAVARVLPRGEPGSMGDMVHYHLETGGKRLRPILVQAAVEALGGDPTASLPFAAGVELLHNATLIHDDYQDGDRVRRGKTTVWVKYGWEQSINAGDAAYFAGMRLVAEADVSEAQIRRLFHTASSRLLQVIGGQVDEFRLKAEARPSEADYIRVIRGKTAGLFALPLEGAAVCAGLSPEETATLAAAGDTLGLLFQVQDDLLDLIGEKGRDQVGTDIAEGKPSLPVVRAMATSPEADRLAAIIHKPREATTPAEIGEAIAILERSGAMDHALKQVAAWRSEIVTGRPALDSLLTDLVTAVVAPIAHRL